MRKGQRIGYVRVSTLDQNTERQLDGIKLEKVFTDKASGRDTKRPQLAAALEYLREGDTLIVHSLDRLARNVDDLRRIVRELNERGVSVEFVKNRLNFSGGADARHRLGLLLAQEPRHDLRDHLAAREDRARHPIENQGQHRAVPHRSLRPAQAAGDEACGLLSAASALI